MILPYQGDSDFLQAQFIRWAEETPEGQDAELHHLIAFNQDRTELEYTKIVAGAENLSRDNITQERVDYYNKWANWVKAFENRAPDSLKSILMTTESGEWATL